MSDIRDTYQFLLSGGKPVAFRDGQIQPAKRPSLLFPGAFNPLHDGHREMARVASDILGRQPAFEISIYNVDKAPLSTEAIGQRLKQGFGSLVWVTPCATFSQKSQQFPNCTFIVGADTLSRIANPKYYDSESHLTDSIREIAARGCRFLAFGRLDTSGAFQTASQLRILQPLSEIVDEVPESQFRVDLSSTAIRKNS